MKRIGRYHLWIAGCLAILLAAAGVIVMFTLDSRVAGSVVARPLGWLAPIVALFVIMGAGWLLLIQRRSGSDPRPSFERTSCPECSHEVLGQWRMCPYCGGMLNGAPTSPGPASDL